MALTATLWHNPRCAKSRAALALLADRGIVPQVRLYLKEPPTRAEIVAARDALGVPAIAMMRPKEPAFRDAGLSVDMPEDRLIDAMATHPVLIERPVLFANGRAAIGRPPEAILAIL